MSNTTHARQAVVTIYTGDYLDRIRHLEAQANAHREATPNEASRRADEVPEYLRIAEEHDALVAEAEKHAIHVRVQAVRRSKWKAMVAEHPPREGDEVPRQIRQLDRTYGVNDDTFKEVLVPVAIVEVTQAGETKTWDDMTADAREDFLDSLADVDFDRIYYTAFALVRAPAADPKASLVSQLSQPRDETSS